MFIRNNCKNRERGQSITELAIMLPVLLMIVAGTLEVTNLLTTYNRVQLVAREGARYGGGGGSNTEIGDRSYQISPDPLEVAYEDVYVVRPVVNSSGTGWVDGTWSETLVYDGSAGVAGGSGLSGDNVFSDLLAGASGPSYLADMELVVVVVNYNADTVLGMSIMPGLEGRVPLQAYGAMPLQVIAGESDPTEGCFFFPMGCNIEDLNLAAGGEFEPGDIVTMDLVGSGEDAGCDFAVCDVGPGSSDGAAAMNSGCIQGSDPNPPNGYIEPEPYPEDEDEEPDYNPSVGDWVWGVDEQSAGHGIWNALMHHCDTVGAATSCPEDPRALPIFIYDTVLPFDSGEHGGSVSSQIYRIQRFAIVRILGVEFDGSHPVSVTLEFLSWMDNNCGQ